MRPVMVYYVALPFIRVDGGLGPGEAVECPYEAAAIRRAQAMACSEAVARAVAFSWRGRPDLGEFEDAVILNTFGDVPDDFVAPERRQSIDAADRRADEEAYGPSENELLA
jgi:hypothetical protein